MSLLVFPTTLIFLSICDGYLWTEYKTCEPRYHHWQPFCGNIPAGAFLAGTDRDGLKKYVARVVSPDGRSWSAPTTLSEGTMQVFFSWGGDRVENVERYLEILCVNEHAPGFGFRSTNKPMLVHTKLACCFVEGGSGYVNGTKEVSYVGRTLNKGVYYVGGVTDPVWRLFYTVYPFRYVDEFGKAFSSSFDFEVLAYDCCTENYCRQPNKADCCYDIL